MLQVRRDPRTHLTTQQDGQPVLQVRRDQRDSNEGKSAWDYGASQCPMSH